MVGAAAGSTIKIIIIIMILSDSFVKIMPRSQLDTHFLKFA